MAEIVLNVELREKNISRLRRDCGDRIPPLRRTRGLSDVKRIRPPQEAETVWNKSIYFPLDIFLSNLFFLILCIRRLGIQKIRLFHGKVRWRLLGN